MRKKNLFILLSVLIFLAVCIASLEANIKYVFAEMRYGSQGTNSDIVFSKKSGFYNREFELSIYAPTEEIYYTLDGSDPDKNSIKYETPIKISDASLNENVYSMRADVSARFLEDEIIENGGEVQKEPIYKLPEYPVDKCNVIKVVYYDEAGRKSEISERVYFIGFDQKAGYEDINVISITTAPDNLFDDETGIYVLGEKYSEFAEVGMEEDYWARTYWHHWDANYHQRGIEWERESNIQIFDENKNHVLSQNVGIRIQGGGSRGFLPKSLNIYAREEYGENKLYYDLFGTGYYPKRVTLTTGGDDYYTKIKDRLISELAEDCDIVTMNYEPYVLFLNGEYWGFYYLTEKYDVEFFENYYGVPKGKMIDDVIIIKNDKVEAGVDADWYVSYAEMKDAILNYDLSIQENYEHACQLVDIDSFIDYFAVEGYIARCGDWPDSNFALWRSRYNSGKMYEDGKWRWILFDVNSTSITESLITHDVIGGLRGTSELFDSFCANETFRRKFAERLIELSDTIFAEENVKQKISEYVTLMDQPMKKHFSRFFGTSDEKFYEGIEDITVFFEKRKSFVMDSIETHFGEEYLGENQ